MPIDRSSRSPSDCGRVAACTRGVALSVPHKSCRFLGREVNPAGQVIKARGVDVMQAWIADETATADLGDERLNQRYRLLLDRLSGQPSLSIPAACHGRADVEAAYRCF